MFSSQGPSPPVTHSASQPQASSYAFEGTYAPPSAPFQGSSFQTGSPDPVQCHATVPPHSIPNAQPQQHMAQAIAAVPHLPNRSVPSSSYNGNQLNPSPPLPTNGVQHTHPTAEAAHLPDLSSSCNVNQPTPFLPSQSNGFPHTQPALTATHLPNQSVPSSSYNGNQLASFPHSPAIASPHTHPVHLPNQSVPSSANNGNQLNPFPLPQGSGPSHAQPTAAAHLPNQPVASPSYTGSQNPFPHIPANGSLPTQPPMNLPQGQQTDQFNPYVPPPKLAHHYPVTATVRSLNYVDIYDNEYRLHSTDRLFHSVLKPLDGIQVSLPTAPTYAARIASPSPAIPSHAIPLQPQPQPPTDWKVFGPSYAAQLYPVEPECQASQTQPMTAR
eukprot:gene19250-941_t